MKIIEIIVKYLIQLTQKEVENIIEAPYSPDEFHQKYRNLLRIIITDYALLGGPSIGEQIDQFRKKNSKYIIDVVEMKDSKTVGLVEIGLKTWTEKRRQK